MSDIKKDLGYCGSRSKQRAWREVYSSYMLSNFRFLILFWGAANPNLYALLMLVKTI